MQYIRLFFLGFLLVFLLQAKAFAQLGGKGVYTFLNMPKSARIAAVGGSYLTIDDGDINNAISNPSLINSGMHNKTGLAFVDYYSDIAVGFASYSRTFDKAGSFTGSIQFIDYGAFDRADATGERLGKFTAGEYAFTIGWGRSLNPNFSIGANLKGIWANYDRYTSTGIAVDIAGTYVSDDKRTVASLIVTNIGRQLTAFTETGIEPVNYDIKMGVMRDFEHTPFRLFLLTNHLQKWDLQYDDPNDPEKRVDPVTGETEQETGIQNFADNLLRHIVVGTEVSLTDNFHIRGGYNYQRRQEMKVPSRIAMVGFSWGFGFRISKFHFNYSRSSYHLNGSPNYISLTTDLDDFFSEN
ncbi:MAG: type IX secretion system protein PorQ [Bacteroidales bacterium]